MSKGNFVYKSYSFDDDGKDPIIAEIWDIYRDSGTNYKWIHEQSGVNANTLANWFTGATKRPQAATINAVLSTLGYKLAPVAVREAVRIVPAMPQPKPRPALEPKVSVRHVLKMATYRAAKRR